MKRLDCLVSTTTKTYDILHFDIMKITSNYTKVQEANGLLNLPLVSLRRARHICIPVPLLLISIAILLHLKHYILSVEHIAE